MIKMWIEVQTSVTCLLVDQMHKALLHALASPLVWVTGRADGNQQVGGIQ